MKFFHALVFLSITTDAAFLSSNYPGLLDRRWRRNAASSTDVPVREGDDTVILVDTVIDSSSAAATKTVVTNEDCKFQCDGYVQFWKDYNVTAEQAPGYMSSILTPYLLATNINTNANNNNNAGSPQQARAYWLYHVARSGYFSSNAVVGTLAHVAHERILQRSAKVANIFQNPVQKLVTLLAEAFVSYDQDWKWVQQGVLNYPWDAAIQAEQDGAIQLQWDHKQSNPLFALAETSRLVRESIGVWGRRVRGSSPGVWLESASMGRTNLSTAASSTVQYPDYYLNDFHYQTDGPSRRIDTMLGQKHYSWDDKMPCNDRPWFHLRSTFQQPSLRNRFWKLLVARVGMQRLLVTTFPPAT